MSSMEEHFLSAGYVLVRSGTHDVHSVREELLKVDAVKRRPRTDWSGRLNLLH